MPCDPFRGDDGQVVGIVCTRGRRRQKCGAEGCSRTASLLCDGPPGPRGGKTCDAPICPAHAVHVGRDRDLCPKCAAAAKVAPEPALFPGPK